VQSTTLIKLSRQGDASAIAEIMSRAFRSHDISVKVKVKADRIKILLEAKQVPSRQRLLPIVAKGIETIQLDDEKVYVYGRQRGSATIAWVAGLNQSSADYLRMEGPAAAAVAASTASLGLPPGAATPDTIRDARLREEHLVRELYSEISRRLADEQISGLSTVSDIELEGQDVLVTFETRETLDSRALADLVRQATLSVNADTYKIARLYKRHPRTQRSLPIRDILLGPAPARATRGPARLTVAERDATDFETLKRSTSASATQRQGLNTALKALRLGLLGLAGLGGVLALAGWISPLIAVLMVGISLIVWQVSAHWVQRQS